MSTEQTPAEFQDPSGLLPDATPEAVACSTKCCPMTRAIRVLMALVLVLGVGTYAALAVQPDLAKYLSFIPESQESCPLRATVSMLTGGDGPCCSQSMATGTCSASANLVSTEGSCSASAMAGGSCSASSLVTVSECPLEAAKALALQEAAPLLPELVSADVTTEATPEVTVEPAAEAPPEAVAVPAPSANVETTTTPAE